VVLSNILKAISIMGLNTLAIIGNGEQITLEALSVPKTTNDTYTYILGETDKEFKVFLRKENLILMKDDYNVQITDSFVKFVGQNLELEYYIAPESERND
jgi:hypothetical protein